MNESDLKDFFATAHALEIDGLTGDICLSYIDQSAAMESEPAIPAINGLQYQSTATVRIHGVDNGVQDQNYGQTIEYVYVDEIENAGNDMGIDQTQYAITNGTSMPDSTQWKSVSPKVKKRARRYKGKLTKCISN